MSSKKSLVTDHLEKVSRNVLEKHKPSIRELIRGKSGVYALYRKGRLYYVGLASNLMGRLKVHLNDRHGRAWDEFSVYLTVRVEHIKELESLILRITSPSGNKVAGKFTKARNLRRELHKRMTARSSDDIAEMMGGYIAKRRRKIKARNASRQKPLAGLVSRRMLLKGFRGGYEYRASLLKNGSIRYKDRTYDNPSAAAKAALPGDVRTVNGWAFWHYKDRKSGEWERLSKLKS